MRNTFLLLETDCSHNRQYKTNNRISKIGLSVKQECRRRNSKRTSCAKGITVKKTKAVAIRAESASWASEKLLYSMAIIGQRREKLGAMNWIFFGCNQPLTRSHMSSFGGARYHTPRTVVLRFIFVCTNAHAKYPVTRRKMVDESFFKNAINARIVT